MGTGQWLLSKPSWPFYPVPLTRYMALLFLYSRKESIEKIKNVASGEFKIRFLQNTKWKREENNRNREPHDLHKTYICGLGVQSNGIFTVKVRTFQEKGKKSVTGL